MVPSLQQPAITTSTSSVTKRTACIVTPTVEVATRQSCDWAAKSWLREQGQTPDTLDNQGKAYQQLVSRLNTRESEICAREDAQYALVAQLEAERRAFDHAQANALPNASTRRPHLPQHPAPATVPAPPAPRLGLLTSPAHGASRLRRGGRTGSVIACAS